jgi:hypothetical protein
MLELAHAAAEAGSGGTQILVAILGAGGISAIVASVVTGLFSKKKLGSEATEIITRAASGVVTSIEAELLRAQEARERDRLEHQRQINRIMDDHRSEMNEVGRVLQLHVAWDAIAIAKMSEFGVQLPKAPPLLPPNLGHSIHEFGVE